MAQNPEIDTKLPEFSQLPKTPIRRFVSDVVEVCEDTAMDLQANKGLTPRQALGDLATVSSLSVAAFKLSGFIKGGSPMERTARYALKTVGIGFAALSGSQLAVTAGFGIHGLREAQRFSYNARDYRTY